MNNDKIISEIVFEGRSYILKEESQIQTQHYEDRVKPVIGASTDKRVPDSNSGGAEPLDKADGIDTQETETSAPKENNIWNIDKEGYCIHAIKHIGTHTCDGCCLENTKFVAKDERSKE